MSKYSASSAMGGGKSLQNNQLRNLLVSISAFTVIAVMFFASSESVYSQFQCPQGYGNPITTVVYLCDGDCPVLVTWCCGQGVSTPFPRIYIHQIEFLELPSSSCPCISWAARPIPYPAVPVIPMSELIDGLIFSGALCFNQYLTQIPPCDTEPQEFKIQISNGGCYEYVTTLDFIGYRPCGNPQITECHVYYTICIEQDENGQWKSVVTPSLPPLPTFTCEDPECFSMCDVLAF